MAVCYLPEYLLLSPTDGEMVDAGVTSKLATLAAGSCSQGCQFGREICPNLATLAAEAIRGDMKRCCTLVAELQQYSLGINPHALSSLLHSGLCGDIALLRGLKCHVNT